MFHCFSDLHLFTRDPLGFLLDKGASANDPLIPLHLGKKAYLVANPEIISQIKNISIGAPSKGSVFDKLKYRIQNKDEHSVEFWEADYIQIVSSLISKNIAQITAIVRKNMFRLAGQSIFSANNVMGPTALNIISTLLFGPSKMSDSDEYAFIKAVKLVEEQLQHPLSRVLPGIESDDNSYMKLQVSRKIVRTILKRLRKKATTGSLCWSIAKLKADERELDNEILALVLIGYYFIGGTAPWALYFLATQDGLQESLALEAEVISDNGGELCCEGLPSAKVSVALINEILRLYPPVWWSSRKVKNENIIDGYRLTADTKLIISPWQLGRDPRYWQKPDEFSLNRGFDKSAFCPFGAGSRANISSVIVTTILQIIILNFALSNRLSYKSRFPASPPRTIGALMPPDISLSI